MSERTRGIRNWTILVAVIALLAASGLALAQDGENESDKGPPWLRPEFEATWSPGTKGPPPWAKGKGPPWLRPEFEDSDWKPGTPGPPPWAGKDDDDNGLGPPWLRPEFEGTWSPGTKGPPPWLRPEFEDNDWKPGTPGPPPWAGQDDD